MIQDPRLRRLEADYRAILDLKSRTNLIDFHVLSTHSPPDRYGINFKCKGIMINPTTNKPCITVSHAVEVYLHSGYPVQQPQMKWQTPIFHPNINGHNGKVCIQYWTPSMSLADLVVMLGNMVRFQIFNPKSPLDSAAAKWAEENKNAFPIDERPLLTAEVKIDFGRPASTNEDEQIRIELS